MILAANTNINLPIAAWLIPYIVVFVVGIIVGRKIH